MVTKTQKRKLRKAAKQKQAELTGANKDIVRDQALASVVVGEKPDVAATDDLGVTTVQDPYDRERRLVAVTNLRDDPLGRLAKRKQVDNAQFAAGRHWQDDWEAAEIGGARAIDTTKEAVDGGRFVETLSDRQIRATKHLTQAMRALGQEGEALVRDVLAKRWSLAQCAAARGLDPTTSGQDVRYLGRRLRECLETLAWCYGYAVDGKAAKASDRYAEMARDWSPNSRLFVAVRAAARAPTGVDN